MASTKYTSVEKVELSIPIFIHNIDQLYWFRSAMIRTLPDDKDENAKKLLSNVRFHLPYFPGKEGQSFLNVVGDGCGIANIYLVRLSQSETDKLFGVCSQQDSALWKLFSYSEKRDLKLGYEREIERKIPLLLNQIFPTDIAPFLKGRDYPLECNRVYDIRIKCGSERIRIIAENRKDRLLQRLVISFAPDPREGKEETIEILTHKSNVGWTSESLLKKIGTPLFTFASTMNAFYP
ncbi:MAG: hypothetical protein AABX07_03535 [Nanoarchaeota archaeon]